MIFVCHVNLQGHLMKGACDFMGILSGSKVITVFICH